MKRFILIGLLISTMLFSGCGNSDLEYKKIQLQEEIATLQTEIDTLQEIRDGLIQKDDIVYVLEVEISQSHFTIDIGEHLKDGMNKITIPIQVSEEYYHSIEVGETLSDEFRVGSFMFKGSIGNWKVKVIDKQTVTAAE